ncbi:MAG: alpha-D-glucose phosphate-specific phosphoglucomutase, partial [Burkholderiaceae bacterium]|nr:alpha-D-glucose phosphate-specific phosphoglucomutase [Burkholderiaceae bacterium]
MISSGAGRLVSAQALVNIPQLLTAYFALQPQPDCKAQQVSFGTSGHRGSSLTQSFNEWHVLAICQAICFFRAKQGWNGPLFIGADTHALSSAAFATAIEVLAGNGVEVMISLNNEPTPTPAVSLAILSFNQGRTHGLADGIVITSSHNPPDSGGLKYNPPHGGAANSEVTNWIQDQANQLMQSALAGVKRLGYLAALHASTTHNYDYLTEYVQALPQVINMKLIADSKLRLAVDPLGGAGVHYWPRIAEKFGLDLTVLNNDIDPTFRFVCADWDGAIRMDPSSSFVMQNLVAQKDHYDILGACDTDHDRHGIVTPVAGLIPTNHFLLVAIDYLFQQRHDWKADLGIGKTVVTSQSIDRLAVQLKRPLYETPAGFKWFAEQLQKGNLGFCGEESAGAS